jgi:hypothetical protein
MAKIIEQNIVVRVSQLAKKDGAALAIPAETLLALEQVAQELLGESVIVEVELG